MKNILQISYVEKLEDVECEEESKRCFPFRVQDRQWKWNEYFFSSSTSVR